MNEDILKGKWNQLKGELQKEWVKLTDSDVDQIEGELTRLQGVLEEKYGQSSDEIKKKIKEFINRFDEDISTS